MTAFRAAAALLLALAPFALTPFALAPFFCGAARGEEAVPEPSGYRNQDYRAPTPATLAGARVVTTDEAEALWRDGTAVFVDVLPRAPRPPNLPAGTIWRDRPRANIPGSTWLPDTGYGDLAPSTQDYLRRNIERVRGGDRMKLVVIYCLRDCWMSWNAAKRVLAMGYVNVAWYPDGTDGWTDALLPVADAQPAPAAEP
jgi:PQQ-dependent catabolism-associated CXXCW motif protein